MEQSFIVVLTEDGAQCVVRGIGLDNAVFRGIEVPEDRTDHEAGLQSIESRLGTLCPYKLDVLLEEGSERGGDLRVILYKAAVKVGETEETLDIEDGLRSSPILDSCYLSGVHGDTFSADNKTQKNDLLLIELAFLKFQTNTSGF